jgi:hypothetical protein
LILLIPGLVGVPSDKGFSHALLSPIFAVYGTGVLPCVGYLAADGTVYCLAADTHYYVEDLRDAGLGLAAGFRLKAAELPSSVALVGELVAPVAFTDWFFCWWNTPHLLLFCLKNNMCYSL